MTRHAPARALVAALVALSAACTDGATAPARTPALDALADAAAMRAPALGACDRLAAPAGSQLAFVAYARGVQQYRWTGTAWVLVGPIADLYADAAFTGKVGTHFVGPTWQMNSGGGVTGAVLDRCPSPDGAIPWLQLAASPYGPGVLQGVTHIQRLATVGGVAPSTPGAFVGDETGVAYTAEYWFWRAP